MNTNTISLSLPLSLKGRLEEKSNFLVISLCIAVLMALFLSVFYIFQVNARILERHALVAHQKELMEIGVKKDSLEFATASSASLKNAILAIKEDERGFEETDMAKHIRVVENKIVLRNADKENL